MVSLAPLAGLVVLAVGGTDAIVLPELFGVAEVSMFTRAPGRPDAELTERSGLPGRLFVDGHDTGVMWGEGRARTNRITADVFALLSEEDSLFLGNRATGSLRAMGGRFGILPVNNTHEAVLVRAGVLNERGTSLHGVAVDTLSLTTLWTGLPNGTSRVHLIARSPEGLRFVVEREDARFELVRVPVSPRAKQERLALDGFTPVSVDGDRLLAVKFPLENATCDDPYVHWDTFDVELLLMDLSNGTKQNVRGARAGWDLMIRNGPPFPCVEVRWVDESVGAWPRTAWARPKSRLTSGPLAGISWRGMGCSVVNLISRDSIGVVPVEGLTLADALQ